MIEVFKTNITSREDADKIISSIHLVFAGYKANFDLWDCDNILRIQSSTDEIKIDGLITFLAELGCNAEVLPDNPISQASPLKNPFFDSQFISKEAV